MIGLNIDILCWNVRGLNRQDRKDVVHQTLAATWCHIACLQESKLSSLDQHVVAYLGGFRLRGFVFKPATGVLGT
jgi:exonuclease III